MEEKVTAVNQVACFMEHCHISKQFGIVKCIPCLTYRTILQTILGYGAFQQITEV
jgi:hypothetical protein